MFPSLDVDRYARHVEKAVRSGVRWKFFWISELHLVSRYGARCELGLAPRSCNSEWAEEISRWERKEDSFSSIPVFQFYSRVFTVSAQEIFATDR